MERIKVNYKLLNDYLEEELEYYKYINLKVIEYIVKAENKTQELLDIKKLLERRNNYEPKR